MTTFIAPKIIFAVFVTLQVANHCTAFAFSHDIAAPSPPFWDTQFAAIGNIESSFQGTWNGAVMIYYDWNRKSELMNWMFSNGTSSSSLNVNTTVWALNRNVETCCVDPTQTGVTPPRPDWLQGGEYIGVTRINEVPCNGWRKQVDNIAFSWYTSVATQQPFRLGWLDLVNMTFSYYSTNPADFPNDIFDVPDYCPDVVTDPNCRISQTSSEGSNSIGSRSGADSEGSHMFMLHKIVTSLAQM